MFKFFRKKKKIGCPVCHETNTIGFGTDYLESKFDSRIEQTEKIGNTQTYKCSICGSDFYKEGEMFQKFANGQMDTLKEFVMVDLQLNDKLKTELDEIGLTDDWNMNKIAPAKVKLKNGQSYDFATIRVSNNPPIGYYIDHFSKVIFINKVDSIEPSEFGISQEIREKAKNAEEMRMGFYPVPLKTSNGTKVVINGQVMFFKNGEIKGSDLKLENELWNHKIKYVYEDKIENQVLIVAKK
ncbi:hypothetical protein [Polaribacter sp. M15]